MGMSGLIIQVQEIIYYLRIQHYPEGRLRFLTLVGRLQADPGAWEGICPVLSRMLEALEAEDMVLLGDLLEEALLPALKEMIVPGEPVIVGDYCLEYTSSGCLTAKYLPGSFYLHSNCNPMEEARILVERCFDADKERYIVWGCGLGYHVRRLYEAAQGAVSITVFDEGEEIFRLAREYGVLAELPADRVTCVADGSGEHFARYLSEHVGVRHSDIAHADVSRVDADVLQGVGILMHLPSVKAIGNQALKDSIMRFCMGWNSTIQLREKLAVNFRQNEKNCSRNVDEIAQNIAGREAVVVAAGPSLDRSLDFLREAVGRKVILAVATVWKKLLDLGIVPDYVVVMDAHARTYGQFAGITSREVPLIVDSTAYWEFAAGYGGIKYIAYQKDYEKSEKCARETGHLLYETGGSVTTLALDIVLRHGAKAVYLVGADLAYPAGVSHASGTMDRHTRDVSGMMPVEAADGGIVYADRLFIAYRKWIEAKIKEHPEVAFYNLSDCGAKIEGARAPAQ